MQELKNNNNTFPIKATNCYYMKCSQWIYIETYVKPYNWQIDTKCSKTWESLCWDQCINCIGIVDAMQLSK